MWGDALPVTIHIYKGEESKKTGELYVEKNGKKASPMVKITMPEKYTSYDLTVPLTLDTNCGTSFPDGTAKVILEAFGQQVEASFVVGGINSKDCSTSEEPKTRRQEELLSPLSLSFCFLRGLQKFQGQLMSRGRECREDL